MEISFGRAPGHAEVEIDHEACTLCGRCVSVCGGAVLYVEDAHVCVDHTRLFGCFGCGQCVAVCPEDCIRVAGRDFYPEDVLPLPPAEERASYKALLALLYARRSVRDFAPPEVEHRLIERILDAAATAPMGVPPSEVGVRVFAGRQAVVAFRDDLLAGIRSMRWLYSPVALALMRPFIGGENYRMLKGFIAPIVDIYLQGEREGVDWLTYGAPLALYFYASAYADPADPIIAATQAMLAGVALGLGTCMLGIPGYVMRYSRRLRAKYGLPKKMQPGLTVILGYPAVTYRRALRRRFAEVRWV